MCGPITGNDCDCNRLCTTICTGSGDDDDDASVWTVFGGDNDDVCGPSLVVIMMMRVDRLWW